MTEFENLTLEHLRALRAENKQTHSKLREIEQHLLELRMSVAALERDDARLYGRLAEHESRRDRIEQRLNLRDE